MDSCKYCITTTTICGSSQKQSPYFVCTREKGHKGDHVGCGSLHGAYRWRQRRQRRKKDSATVKTKTVEERILALELRDKAIYGNYQVAGTSLYRQTIYPGKEQGWGLELGPEGLVKTFYGPCSTIAEVLEDAEIQLTELETARKITAETGLV
jgi:hypothetical protein